MNFDRRQPWHDLEAVAFGSAIYTQLASTALAVLVRRVDGWCVYVSGVPGWDHDREAPLVASHGDKVREPLARAILAHLFHPPIDPGGLPYAT